MQAPLEPSYRIICKVIVGLAASVIGTAVCNTSECAAASRGATKVVEISLVGRAANDPTLGSRITSWFDHKRFQISVRTVSKLESQRVLTPDNSGAVHIWVSVGTDNVAHLYFATASKDKRHPAYLVRDLPLEHGLDEMGAERIGQVLHLSTVAIIDGQAETGRADVEQRLRGDSNSDTAVVARPHEEHDSQPLLVGSATNSPKTLELAVGYGVGFHGDEGLWHGPRGSLELYLRRELGFGALLRTALPNSTTINVVTQRVEALQFQLYAAYHVRVTPAFEVYAYAGPGFELVHHVPTKTSDTDATLSPGQTDTRPNLGVGFGFTLGKGSPFLSLVLEGTALFSESRYRLLERRRNDVNATAAGFAPGVAVEVRF